MFERLKKLKEYATSEHVAPISRRYFVMNGFDGAMTVLGVIIGALIAGITTTQELRLVLFSALGSTLAIGLSGTAGAFMAEKAERVRELKELEKRMMKDMESTAVGSEAKIAPIWVSIVDGGSPVLTALTTLVPLFFGMFFPEVIKPQVAGYLALIVSLTVLFTLGAYLGKISKRSVILNGLKMVAAGVFMTGILFLAGGF